MPPDKSARQTKPASRRAAAVSNVVGHGATVAITVVQAFVLVPLCLVALGAHLYGAWLAAAELLGWIQLLDVGIPALLAQRVGAAIGRGDRPDAARWSATGLVVLGGVAAILTGLGMVAAPFVGDWVSVAAGEADLFSRCFRAGVVASALLLVFNGILGLGRGTQRPGIVNAAQVLGVITGLAVSVALLLAGWGLWALAVGLLARALVSLAGGVWFLVRLPDPARWLVQPSRSVVREVGELAPSMFGASVGYLLAYNTEIFVVAAVLGPVPALVYALTRRTIDGLRNLLDVFVTAVHGGFAHLVAADVRARSRAVMQEVLWLRLAAACLSGAVALSVNQGFVTLLFGAENFGGFWLTVAFAMQMIVSGQALLANALLRAAGRIREGSWLLLGEALLRVVATFVGLSVIGLVGAPWATAVVSAIAWITTRRWLDAALPPSTAPVPPLPARSRWAPAIVAALGLAAGAIWIPLSWTAVGATAAIVAATGAWFLWIMRPPGSGRGTFAGWARG